MASNDVAVERVMTTGLVSVTPDTPVEEAGHLLLEHDIGSLLVANQDGGLAGIMTSTDFVDVVTRDRSTDDHTVEQYMTTGVVTVKPSDSISDAAARMLDDDVQHLPVEADDGNVAGLVSTTDLTAHLAD